MLKAPYTNMDRASPLKGVSNVSRPWMGGYSGVLSSTSLARRSSRTEKSASAATKPLGRSAC